MKKIFRTFRAVIWGALIALILLLGVSLLPIPGNYQVFTVQSGSMEPAIGTGSLIVVKSQGSYVLGDIVTRKGDSPKTTITHRIVAEEERGGERYFQTKGDANNAPDAEFFSEKMVVGKTLFSLPFLGYPIGYAKTVPGLIVMIVIPGSIIVYEELRNIKEEIGRQIKIKKEKREKKMRVEMPPVIATPEPTEGAYRAYGESFGELDWRETAQPMREEMPTFVRTAPIRRKIKMDL